MYYFSCFCESFVECFKLRVQNEITIKSVKPGSQIMPSHWQATTNKQDLVNLEGISLFFTKASALHFWSSLTSLSNPKKMIIRKKKIAHSCGTGIRATARGKAMNANPEPERADMEIKIKPNQWTVWQRLIQLLWIYPLFAPSP